jgi:dephospho-CoA kinase
MARDGISEDYARSRIAAQHSNNWFAANCDHVLLNKETEEAFRAKCLAFLQGLGIMK